MADRVEVGFPYWMRDLAGAALADHNAKLDAWCQALLAQGEIPVIVEMGLSAEVISTHEYVRRYGPPPLPRRERQTEAN